MPDCPGSLDARLRAQRGPGDSRLAERRRRLKDQARGRESLAVQIRSTARWQRLREMIRSKAPLCADPYGTHAREGRIIPATEMHHIVPIAQDPSLAFTMSNIQPLCRDCHERLEPKTWKGREE